MRTTHGFLDATSFMILGAMALVLAVLVGLLIWALRKRSKQK